MAALVSASADILLDTGDQNWLALTADLPLCGYEHGSFCARNVDCVAVDSYGMSLVWTQDILCACRIKPPSQWRIFCAA